GYRARTQRLLDPATVQAHIVTVEGVREQDVRAGVEAGDQLAGLVVQVRLHGEPPGHRQVLAPRVLAGLGAVGEPLVQLELAPVAQVRDPAGDTESGHGSAPGAVVSALLPVRVRGDGHDLRRLHADLVGGGAGADGQDTPRPRAIGVADHPLEGPRPAHGCADHRGEALDAEQIREDPFRLDHVPYGDGREAGAPVVAVRVQGAGAGRPPAPAEDVDRQDAVVV